MVNWVTLSGSPSGSLSLVSTLPLMAVSSAVVALSSTALGAGLATFQVNWVLVLAPAGSVAVTVTV